MSTLSTHLTKPPTSSVPSPLPGSNRQVIGGKATDSGENNSENKKLIIVAIAFAVTATLAILVSITTFKVYGWRTNRGIDKIDGNEPDQLNRVASPSQEQLNTEPMTLERLENDHQELFDWMCVKLDNGRLWYRRDYERLAAKYKKISLEQRNTLHDELQRKGSPSKMLMSLLQTKYPNLRLRDFVGTLKEIGRNDIAQKLMPYAG